MWWRRRQQGQQPEGPPNGDRQVWLRTTHPIESITGQYGEWEPVVGDQPGRIYDDEIDPEWRDPETIPGAEYRPSREHSADGRPQGPVARAKRSRDRR